MDRIFSVNLLWSLLTVTGIIIGGALWFDLRRDRIAAAAIEPEARVSAISADELPILESDPERASAPLGGRDRSIVIEETTDDDDAEPPYIEWFY